MQEIAQHWEQLLYTTGDALSLENFFVALEWQFINNEHTLSTPTAMSTSISLSSGNNYTKCVPILQSSTSEGKHTTWEHGWHQMATTKLILRSYTPKADQ